MTISETIQGKRTGRCHVSLRTVGLLLVSATVVLGQNTGARGGGNAGLIQPLAELQKERTVAAVQSSSETATGATSRRLAGASFNRSPRPS
jgi:hypothetical protein